MPMAFARVPTLPECEERPSVGVTTNVALEVSAILAESATVTACGPAGPAGTFNEQLTTPAALVRGERLEHGMAAPSQATVKAELGRNPEPVTTSEVPTPPWLKNKDKPGFRAGFDRRLGEPARAPCEAPSGPIA